MHNTNLLELDLQLFNGAAGGAAAGGDGAAGDGAAQASESALPKAETNRGRGSSRRARSGAYDNVVFGKQEDASAAENTNIPAAGESTEGNSKSGVSTTSDTLEAKRQAFKDLVEGEYKDQYTEMFQSAFNRRFKEVKGMEDSLTAQKPILDMLMQKYKIADGDMGKLQKAIEQDKTYWESAAEEAGLTVEQYQAMQKLERENEELKRMRQRQQGEQAAQQQLNVWMQEADKLKRDFYPDFNLQTEIGNRQFLDLLKAKIPMKQAYELVHMDEIKAATARNAAQTASQQMQANIKAKASRPSENGTSHQSAAIVKSNVSDLSRADRAEIARRVQRGEKISF